MNVIRKFLIDIASGIGFVTGIIMNLFMDLCYLVAPKLYLRLALFFLKWFEEDDEDD